MIDLEKNAVQKAMLEKLKQKALQVHRKEWFATCTNDENLIPCVYAAPEVGKKDLCVCVPGNGTHIMQENIMDYIAVANPKTILELIELVQKREEK